MQGMQVRKKPGIAFPVAFAAVLFQCLAGPPGLGSSGAAGPTAGTAAAQETPTPAESRVLPGGERVSERLFGLRGLSNVGRVAPGVYRGANPSPEGYETLARMGVRTVVNLRSGNGEREMVESYGMRSVGLPMSAYGAVDADTVRRAVALMADPANQPVYVHCLQGRDRTGVVVAVYRMEVDGWSPNEAEEEMQAYGFHDVWFRMKDFVRRYRSGNGTGGGPANGGRVE